MTAPIIPQIPFDPQRKARALYFCGYPISQIAEVLDIPRTTVDSWKKRGKWDEATPLDKVEVALEDRLSLLIGKDQKTGGDFKEIDLMMRQMVSAARIRRYEAPGGHEGDLNPKVANRNKGEKKPQRRNLIDREAVAKLTEAFQSSLFGFQENWRNTTSLRTRFILKSRQIGATWYFARERLIRALETGRNQIFISASRAQAYSFLRFIRDFVMETLGIELKGDPLVIDRGDDEDGNPLPPVRLFFLGTNYRTAQGYTGDVIFDECFWVHNFAEIFKVVSACATQSGYTRTLFSTPSTVLHEAHALWSGEAFNAERTRQDQVKIDTSHEALRSGEVGADGFYRQIITLHDAIASGFDLADVEVLRSESSVSAFANIYECQFVDDAETCFPRSLLEKAAVDSWEKWKSDFRPMAVQPYDGEVWIGYDPSHSEQGDTSAIVVVAAPRDRKSKFRVLEKKQFRGADYQEQAAFIKSLKAKYGQRNVTEIAIDTTGTGHAVYQMVREFHPTARSINYSPAEKSLMVLKAQNVFRNGRIEYDRGTMRDLAGALMSIRPQITKSGKQVTYVSRRSAAHGHGDLAWALLHALYCEPLENTDGTPLKRSRVGITRHDEFSGEGAGRITPERATGRRSRRERRQARIEKAGQSTGLQLRGGGKRHRRGPVPQSSGGVGQRALLRAAG